MTAVRILLCVAWAILGVNAQAQVRQFVVAQDVEIQYIRGEMRFCERKFVRGLVCGFEQKLFGKKSFAARDWWSAETYVQAMTGLNEFTLYNVEPTRDGRGIIIYFSP